MPVAVLGLAGYVLILASAALVTDLTRAAGAAVALAGFAFGMYLVYVQVSVLGATCDWCLASDGVLVPLVALTLARLAARS